MIGYGSTPLRSAQEQKEGIWVSISDSRQSMPAPAPAQSGPQGAPAAARTGQAWDRVGRAGPPVAANLGYRRSTPIRTMQPDHAAAVASAPPRLPRRSVQPAGLRHSARSVPAESPTNPTADRPGS